MNFQALSFLSDPDHTIRSQSIYPKPAQPKKNTWWDDNSQNTTPVNMFDNFPPPDQNHLSKLSFCQVFDSDGNPIKIDSLGKVISDD